MLTLYNYYRSSASYRVRIALHIKNISYESININLINGLGDQYSESYQEINPQNLVPVLKLEDGPTLTQSLAIIEYLEERIPEPALLPIGLEDRALVRSLAQSIACDIHPLNNLRVLQQLKQQFQATEPQITAWYHGWLQKGFYALEKRLHTLQREEMVCFGTEVTLADLCLIPQVYNAQRFQFPLDNYPLIQAIYLHCMKMPAFCETAP